MSELRAVGQSVKLPELRFLKEGQQSLIPVCGIEVREKILAAPSVRVWCTHGHRYKHADGASSKKTAKESWSWKTCTFRATPRPSRPPVKDVTRHNGIAIDWRKRPECPLSSSKRISQIAVKVRSMVAADVHNSSFRITTAVDWHKSLLDAFNGANVMHNAAQLSILFSRKISCFAPLWVTCLVTHHWNYG